MYYEEQIFEGLLFWRGTPQGEWNEISKQELTTRVLKTEHDKTNMLIFIEKVADFSFEGNKNLYDKVAQAQVEAFVLIKKVRG